MSSQQPVIYDELVAITHVYLGPAAERFIARQAHSHLNKPPEELTCDDLRKLIDWIGIAVSLLTADSAIVEEYMAKLRKLANSQAKKGKK